MHRSQPQTYICYSCFHDSLFLILISIATSFAAILKIKVVLAFFCIISRYVATLCSRYDTHLMLSAVKPRHGKITVIPNNMEHYMSFTINKVTFIDSYQFMLSSLETLSSNLSKDQFRETRKYLESFYIQQPNQPQINNVTEVGEEGEAMHVHEDY